MILKDIYMRDQSQEAHQLETGGEVVAQMEAETLLPVEGRPSGEVASTKGRPCGAGMAAEVGVFSSIGLRQRSIVFDPTRIREFKPIICT